MKFMRRAIAVILIAAFVLLCVGCGKSYRDAIVYFELIEQPETLDAQTAYSDSELLIVRNIYEGLLREDENGKIVKGACENYEKQGLTYIFKLRDKLSWSNGKALTAQDFVYGFRRAVDPRTAAPFAHLLYCIDGAEAVANGASLETLGVEALDKKTLKITLCREDEHFLKTLTMSVSMPCNEAFFKKCVGKYGLKSEYVISNGSYSITKWNPDDFGIRIYRNERYNGEFDANNAAVFFSCVDDETQLMRLGEKNSDMAFIPPTELGDITDDIAVCAVQNKCWLLSVSRDFSPSVRRAFAMSFSGDVYKSSLQNGFTVARSIYPEILGVSEQTNGVGLCNYDVKTAYSVMSGEIANMEDKKFPATKLYFYNADGIKPMVTAIVGHWQQKLGTYINIEESDSITALQSELGEKTLPFAVFPVTAKVASLTDYTRSLGPQTTDAAGLQTQLTNDNSLIPIAFEDTSIAYRKTLSNFKMFPDNGYIDFSFVIKEE